METKCDKSTGSEPELFMDSEFVADKSSLTFVYSGDDKYDHMVFKRPKEIRDHPQFYGHGGICHIPLPIKPWSDRMWFRLSLAVTSLNSRYMERLIPGYHEFTQNFGTAYRGKFRFRFWIFGNEREVEIDDKLPVIDNRLAFCPEIGDPPEFWCALVEKAYAKCHSAYEAIEVGNPINALTDLTGDICQRIDLSQQAHNAAFHAFRIAHMNNSFLVTWRNKDSFVDRELSSQWQESNLLRSLQQLATIQSQSYVPDLRLFVITAVTMFTIKGGVRQPMLRLLDPSVEEATWSGAFCFSDAASWATVSKAYMEGFHPKNSLEMNEFWITYADFSQHFRDVIICSSTHGYDVSMTSQERIYKTSLFGDGYSEVNQGGWINPQYDASLQKRLLSAHNSVRSQLSTSLSNGSKLSDQCQLKLDSKRFPQIQISKVESLKSREQSFKRNRASTRASYLRASLTSKLSMRTGSFREARGQTFGSTYSSNASRSSSMASRLTHNTSLTDSTRCRSELSGRSGRSDLSSRHSPDQHQALLWGARRRSSLPDSALRTQLAECMSITSIFEKKTDVFRPCGAWQPIIHTRGEWHKETSGGPPKEKGHGLNPRYTFYIARSEHSIVCPPPHHDDGKIHVLIALMRDYRSALVKRRSNTGNTTFGFTLYKCKKEEKDQRKKLSKLKCLDDTVSDPETREIATLCALDAGHYMIVPYTAEVGQQGHFLLRVLCDAHPSKHTAGCVLS